MNKFHVGDNILLNKIIHDPNIEIVGIVQKGVWATSKKKKKQGRVLWINTKTIHIRSLYTVVGAKGIEPPTLGLRGPCSTN